MKKSDISLYIIIIVIYFSLDYSFEEISASEWEMGEVPKDCQVSISRC